MRISDWSSDVCSSDLQSDDAELAGFSVIIIAAEGPVEEAVAKGFEPQFRAPLAHRPDERLGEATRCGRQGAAEGVEVLVLQRERLIFGPRAGIAQGDRSEVIDRKSVV